MFTLDIPTILQHSNPGAQWCVRGDHKDYANLEWLDQSAKPSEQDMLDAELAAAKAWRVAKSKDECQTRIYADYPIWKQANLANGFYSEQETTDMKAAIQAIRSAQATAESDIAALETVAAVLAFTW